jgi:hypothetical protein
MIGNFPLSSKGVSLKGKGGHASVRIENGNCDLVHMVDLSNLPGGGVAAWCASVVAGRGARRTEGKGTKRE